MERYTLFRGENFSIVKINLQIQHNPNLIFRSPPEFFLLENDKWILQCMWIK